MYLRHSKFPGGLKSFSFEKLIERKPEMVLELSVKGMLPKEPLGRAMYRKLKVYAGAEHNHAAQQPKVLDIYSGFSEMAENQYYGTGRRKSSAARVLLNQAAAPS